tara:strand:- start:7141 stop:7677 length:537 start_codon:yes stop_codon:yes gene_type:complete
MGRPRFTQVSDEVSVMLQKAQSIANRLDTLEKAKDSCPECDCKMEKGMCMKAGCSMYKMGYMTKGSKSEKDNYCMKNFGKKYSDCSEKQKAQCDKAHSKVEKGEHHKATSFDTRPGGVQFMSETGGQTYNAQYQTNQSLLDSDDVANKGARKFSVNLDALAPNMNPHESAAIGHLTEG